MPIILTELQTKYLFENGRVLENSDGSYVFWKDKWIYFCTKEKEIYPIISFEMAKRLKNKLDGDNIKR